METPSIVLIHSRRSTASCRHRPPTPPPSPFACAGKSPRTLICLVSTTPSARSAKPTKCESPELRLKKRAQRNV